MRSEAPKIRPPKAGVYVYEYWEIDDTGIRKEYRMTRTYNQPELRDGAWDQTMDLEYKSLHSTSHYTWKDTGFYLTERTLRRGRDKLKERCTPPRLLLKFPISVDSEWTDEAKCSVGLGGFKTYKYSTRAIGKELLTIGSETIETIVLEIKGGSNTPIAKLERKEESRHWYSPKYGIFVKNEGTVEVEEILMESADRLVEIPE